VLAVLTDKEEPLTQPWCERRTLDACRCGPFLFYLTIFSFLNNLLSSITAYLDP